VSEISLCCVPGCFGDVLELAPIPLCGHHLRKAYEFAAGLVNERWSMALAEVQAADRAAEPVIVDVVKRDVKLDGYVYFIRFSDRIKIGWSSDPTHRLRNLPHDEVMAIIPGTMADEQGYHKQFAELRVHGEWFRAEQDLQDFIASL
jgi:hypothetical protein